VKAPRLLRATLGAAGGAVLLLAACAAQAGLFDDDEARRAILDLRQRVDSGIAQAERRTLEEATKLREEWRDELRQASSGQQRSALELQNQIEILKADVAKLRGQNEQLARDLSELQRRQKDLLQSLGERLAKLEPIKVELDGKEFVAEQAEQRDYDAALASFRKSDFSTALAAFGAFARRYPQSGYANAVLFWIGNAQYATRAYKEAIASFTSLLQQAPQSPRAPEALLSIANCQFELKDARAGRKLLEELLKTYPQSEAALAAKERLSKLK